MIDYLETTAHFIGKDTINLGLCKHESSYSSGWEKYSLQGCEKVEIWYHEQLRMMRMKGSIMYFMNGHNFMFDKVQFLKGINIVGRILNVEMWESELDVLEYGTIITTQMQPREYITHHTAGDGLVMDERPKDKGHCRFFNDSNLDLKMYDAGRNIMMKQDMNRREIIEGCGWDADGNYLKWEAHYRKPEKRFNKGQAITLSMMMNPAFEQVLKEDLFYQYTRLIPMKTLIEPTSKKDLSTSDIILQMLAEEKINNGSTIEEVKKMLYSRINAIPDEILAKSDKDSRKRSIKALLDKIQTSEASKYDLSEALQKQLSL